MNSVIVDVISISGALVYNKSWSNKTKVELDLSNINNGYYNVRIKSDNKTIQKPLVVIGK